MSGKRSVHSVVLEDHEERYAPPENVLRVGIVGNVVFLTICEYDETHTTQSLRNKTDEFMVDINVLRNTLDFLEKHSV